MKTKYLILAAVSFAVASCGYATVATDAKGNVILTPITKPIVVVPAK